MKDEKRATRLCLSSSFMLPASSFDSCPRQESNLDFELRTLAWSPFPPRGRIQCRMMNAECRIEENEEPLPTCLSFCIHHSAFCIRRALARTRTRNPAFEAPDDLRFHHKGIRSPRPAYPGFASSFLLHPSSLLRRARCWDRTSDSSLRGKRDADFTKRAQSPSFRRQNKKPRRPSGLRGRCSRGIKSDPSPGMNATVAAQRTPTARPEGRAGGGGEL